MGAMAAAATFQSTARPLVPVDVWIAAHVDLAELGLRRDTPDEQLDAVAAYLITVADEHHHVRFCRCDLRDHLRTLRAAAPTG